MIKILNRLKYMKKDVPFIESFTVFCVDFNK